MSDQFLATRDFSSLSVRDLLEARDTYHVHLAHLENVIATAIGRYRLRKEDADYERPQPADAVTYHKAADGPRMLRDTVVRSWSWPCVMVFVNRWQPRDKFRQKPDQMVPRRLYLPDGRVVPTCVIYAPEQEYAPSPALNLSFPSKLIGGGYLIFTSPQGEEHLGSLGCLVTDGDSIYALTNRHVTGELNRPVFSIIRGQRERVGVSHGQQIGKIPFHIAYPGFPATQALSNIDAGLVRVDSVSRWTGQIYGVGELGQPVDLHADTITLDLIGCPVRAYGAASGALFGEIQALFYRYRSSGGFHSVADLLIGPRQDAPPLATKPGDSGTMWVLDVPAPKPDNAGDGDTPEVQRFRPIALQWGGHVVLEGDGEAMFPYALATNLSTICRLLDIEIVRGWNIGYREYWGKVGHYKIAASSCKLVRSKKLQKLLALNLLQIAYADGDLALGEKLKVDKATFVPLADVPDFIWRGTRRRGVPHGQSQFPDHFADMDELGTGPQFSTTNLLSLCEDPAKIDAEVWTAFYDTLNRPDSERGCLPFRVWQFYDAMVGFLQAKDVPRFVAAAGILAHYVGDACQPLHISSLHHGIPGQESDVHDVYEGDMINRNALDLIARINIELDGVSVDPVFSGGHAAAKRVIELMRSTVGRLPPRRVIEVYDASTGSSRTKKMWEQLGVATILNMADGCRCLAEIWESAWRAGQGDALPASKIKQISRAMLKKSYENDDFVRDMWLGEMAGTGGFKAP